MSFRCEVCGKIAPVGTRCTMIPVQKREIIHPFRDGAGKVKREDGKWEYLADEGGRGSQTAKEIKACVICAPPQQSVATPVIQKPQKNKA